MARTKSDNYDSKREAITREAAKLFASKGFGGASIADISKACRVSKSLIYHYYGAKEDILYGVMNDHLVDLTRAISAANIMSSDPKTEFLNLTQTLLDCYAGAEDSQKVLLYDLNHLTPAQRDEIIIKQRSIIERFERVYVRIFPALKDNHGLLRTNIMLFFGSVNWIHTWYNPNGAISRDELVRLTVENAMAPRMANLDLTA